MMSVARRTDLGPRGLLESSSQRCWARDLDRENEGHAENPRKQASFPPPLLFLTAHFITFKKNEFLNWLDEDANLVQAISQATLYLVPGRDCRIRTSQRIPRLDFGVQYSDIILQRDLDSSLPGLRYKRTFSTSRERGSIRRDSQGTVGHDVLYGF
jgi:hypothetical protein